MEIAVIYKTQGTIMDNKLLLIIIAILLPPLAVFLKKGVGVELLISLVLTLLGYLPGILYALYLILTGK